MKAIVGITGASGSIYAASLSRELLRAGHEVHLVFSEMGEKVMRYECGLGKEDFPKAVIHDPANMFSSIASGSNHVDYMVIVPCSMNTMACIAHGISNNLLQRAAGVMLKENRGLIIVPRELPLSLMHVENMRILLQANATILPASPGFYHRPKTIDDLVNHITGKILNIMRIPHQLFPAWSDPAKTIEDQ